MLTRETVATGKAGPRSDEGRLGRGLTARQIVERCEAIDVEQHPFCRAMDATPLDLRLMWLFLLNLQEGVSHDFVTWLALAISRMPDRRICSLIAKQLDDELGSGDFSGIHSELLDRLVVALRPWSIQAPERRVLWPGRCLSEEAARPFHADDPYEAVGALMSGEIFARKMDVFLGRLMQRQDKLSDEALAWLNIHVSVEVGHADDSGVMAQLVPTDPKTLEAIWRGAESQWNCLWTFLDRLEHLRGELLSTRTPA